MNYYRIILLLIFSITAAQAQSSIDITDPCPFPVAVGIEKEFVPNSRFWASSQAARLRAPHYARLHGWKGDGAWTAGYLDIYQYLGIDLGTRYVVTGAATQGRRGSREYILQYYIQFSSDNKTWSMYSNQYGSPLMFEANRNDNGVVRNNFDHPVVARFIRINPQRWSNMISMRIELYGCVFDGEGATFDGKSRITYDVSGPGEFVPSRSDYLKIRFQTNQADGLLFYADGNQGDYIILEMMRGKLYLHIDLGTTASMRGDTTVKAGSLLDDNQWHDVDIKRNGREIYFTVDQLTVTNMTNGDFYQLDLDRQIHLGGIENFLQPGVPIMTTKNFTGCMENVWFDYMHIIKDARLNTPRFALQGSLIMGICQSDPVIPFTFPTQESHLKLTSVTGKRLRVSFDFRTYNLGGLLLLHSLRPQGRVMLKINSNGYIEYSVQVGSEPEVRSIIINRDPLSEVDVFTDGLWHSMYVDIAGSDTGVGLINITVDGRPDASNRQLNFDTTPDYLIGGGDESGLELGFIGCMRYLTIGSASIEQLPPGSNFGVINGTCAVEDRCDPNPCEHGGICTQDYVTFRCNCEPTNYHGSVCHKSKFMVSCEEARQLNPMLAELTQMIDIDDSGPLEAFQVQCIFEHDVGVAVTSVHHDNEAPTLVQGYQEPGSYHRPINYRMIKEQFDELIGRAYYCEQLIRWECYNARLLSYPAGGDPNIPSWGWLVGRTNFPLRYWGGSSPGSGMCACALKSECKANQPCNCDSGEASKDISDEGMLRHKEDLPIMELRFGDTGIAGVDSQKWGLHTLGPLRCDGDSMFDNIVTFHKADATIEFPTFNAATAGDIRFQFRTTQTDGILLQNSGPHDFIEVRIVWGTTIHFRFDVGNGVQTLQMTTAYPLNDDLWHTVHVERNRKQAILIVDRQSPLVLDEPIDQSFRTLVLTSPLVIGASVDYKDGFVGCMRGLMVNGEIMDMRGKVERGEVTYGVKSGCHPKCASNPCFNNGICVEYYYKYVCDCAYTPYRGWDCGREVGANFLTDYNITYTFDEKTGDISTDEETIIIGFVSREKQGILLHIANNNSVKPEFISVELNNNGGVKVVINVGFEYQEINSDVPNVDLTNNQQHVAVAQRFDRGRTIRLQVDNYPPVIGDFSYLPENADTRLDNPRFIHFGTIPTTATGKGFSGCMFRAQFDNIYPFKAVFNDPRSPNVKLYPADRIREDMCAFEERVNPVEAAESRPLPTVPPNATTPVYIIPPSGLSSTDQAILASTLTVIFLLLAGLAMYVGIYFSRTSGDYQTHEATDAEYYDQSDLAVSSAGNKQPIVTTKKEWFI